MSNEPSYEDYVERYDLCSNVSIHYSEKYSDDKWEYRHVILPKPFLKRIPKSYFDPEEPGVLRILSDAEWRGIGITQSLGWEHYEVHAPEPHILLFRREKDYQEKYGPQGKPSDAAKIKAAQATSAPAHP
ncbi:Cyclin-dependent kinases regulatory subunit (Cell division control protein cks1) [Malassezia nana]|uniref:Cyclin-dependent kinases regulatory subunit n=1 Tax=Malassezia nana TaxID=180528 RepID=A0AAF0J216_9BASI|nr:Cyclin-dependent kinases regulatory subunit (Cell division control protein cks1) [Malassezia nana]